MKSAAAWPRQATFAVIVLLLLIYAASAQQISNSPDQDKPVGSKLAEATPVHIKFERGDKITVDNRTTGRIRITGWDKDYVEATATSERGIEAVRSSVDDSSPQKRIRLKADYASRESRPTLNPQPKPTPAESKLPASPTDSMRPASPKTPPPPVPKPAPSPKQIRPPKYSDEAEASVENKSEISIDSKAEMLYNDMPPQRNEDGQLVEVDLEVSVPRYAEIELIKVIRSGVEVTGVETPLTIVGDKSTVTLRNVGAVEVRTRGGAVEVENASGLVDVVTTSGPVNVRRAGSDVRVLSISGEVRVECARGRVNVDNTEGNITLNSVQGDVDANTSNSSVQFAGAIRDDGRYHLKSMSGAVEMTVQDRPPGFTAALSSYRGAIENAFQLKTRQSSQHEEEVNRRIIGVYGNGRAQIMLDTFDGKVNLRKAPLSAMKECK